MCECWRNLRLEHGREETLNRSITKLHLVLAIGEFYSSITKSPNGKFVEFYKQEVIITSLKKKVLATKVIIHRAESQ